MNINAVTFANSVNGILGDSPDASKILSFATGVAVARSIPMPSSSVEGRGEDYNNSITEKAKSLISKVNELYVLDTQYALDVLQAVYRIRFNACFPNTIFLEEDTCICEDIFGIKHYFKSVDMNGIGEDKQAIVTLISKVNAIIYGE